MQKNIVISIGGSVLLSDDIKIPYFKEFKEFIDEYSKKYNIFLVVGGGKTARTYIKLGRKLNFSEETLDLFGIDITRINAKILTNLFDNSNEKIPISTDEAKIMKKPVVVMGGTVPGHSTDMVGAELANKVNAEKFIIATNVDGIYDKDPNKNKDAKKYDEILIDDLINKYGTSWESAGKNMVIDGPALKIIKDNKIKTFVLNGKKISEIKKVINDKKINGTIIKN